MSKGKFVVFEGGEGSGKTTLLNKTYDWLSKTINCIKLREPGACKISEDIRNIIVNKNNTSMDSKTEALLYAASRRQNVVENIIPALNEGKVVLCDRFLPSSLVYQGYARGLGYDVVNDINKYAIDDCKPDYVIWLDIEPELGLKRIAKRKNNNRLDLESLEFHKKVYKGYKEFYKRNSNCVRIDARESLELKFAKLQVFFERILDLS